MKGGISCFCIFLPESRVSAFFLVSFFFWSRNCKERWTFLGDMLYNSDSDSGIVCVLHVLKSRLVMPVDPVPVCDDRKSSTSTSSLL